MCEWVCNVGYDCLSVLVKSTSGPEPAFGFRVLFMFSRSVVVIWVKLNSGKVSFVRYVD